MKTRSKIKYLLPLLILMSLVNVKATDLDDCRNLLNFWYVDKPNDPLRLPVLLSQTEIALGLYNGAFWNNDSLVKIKGLVKALYRDPNVSADPGDANLQFYAAQILSILDKPVIIYLYNDMPAKLNSIAQGIYHMSGKPPFYVWPHAINQTISDDYSENWAKCKGESVPARTDGTWAGTMHLGAHHFNLNSHSLQYAKSTFIHELVHTQDYSDGRQHLFIVNGILFRYGMDQSHYDIEAVPNMAMTYKEGIANTFTLLYEGVKANIYFKWFSDNDYLWVEKNNLPSNSGPGNIDECIYALNPSGDVWLYDSINARATAAGERRIIINSDTQQSTTYVFFRVRDLPAKYIIHNEFILAMILSEYVRHISLPRFMDALQSTNNELLRVSASGVANLFTKMCEAGLPLGATLTTVSQSGRNESKKYLLPLAFADYFTSYKSTTQAEFSAIFENMLNPDWITLYWETERQNVRSSVPITTPEWKNLTEIAIALGITQSEPY